MIIVDTNVVSELLRASPNSAVEAWLATQAAGKVFLTTVSEAELRYGAAIMPAGKRRTLMMAAIDGLLREDFRARILPFDSAAASEYARIGAERKAAGRPISQFDCQIAATARAHGAMLATRNVTDFEGCGIRIVDPWRPEHGQ